ncbi:tetratricopeptide repeat protein [Flocculibacter collagenilyticus]|uniref:tetratricopeptide repeat protein n=1 Tax=Flocculibacter collagenilyticus TaxID=2744479 RepID=UPI0018F386FC|nr:tetratricopeptide repeat protein [Flocculibacter collagenilyticus]
MLIHTRCTFLISSILLLSTFSVLSQTSSTSVDAQQQSMAQDYSQNIVKDDIYAEDFQTGLTAANEGEFDTAIALWEPLVEIGYGPALYEMGLLYENGFGLTKNATKAFELYQRAAKIGDPDAQFALSLMYAQGSGTDKDANQAFYWVQRAAAQGLARAQFNLGVMYQNGEGTIQNDAKAVEWYQNAANKNYALAQYNLALMYFDGLGVAKDKELAFAWNAIAARNGYPAAEKSNVFYSRALSRKELIQAQKTAERIYENINPEN